MTAPEPPRLAPRPPSPLREKLVDAGLALLRDGGLPALTLRRCAARAGVSHAAPAHHFDGLRGLLTAIAARAFALFAARLAAAADHAGPDPRARLRAVCAAYLAFAAEEPALFRLIFGDADKDWADPDLRPPARAAYDALRDACAPFARSPDEAAALETAVRSLLHGHALLSAEGLLADAPGGRPEPSLDALLALLRLPDPL